jgi:hypothetical protein
LRFSHKTSTGLNNGLQPLFHAFLLFALSSAPDCSRAAFMVPLTSSQRLSILKAAGAAVANRDVTKAFASRPI